MRIQKKDIAIDIIRISLNIINRIVLENHIMRIF
jgi:hypothetical protein